MMWKTVKNSPAKIPSTTWQTKVTDQGNQGNQRNQGNQPGTKQPLMMANDGAKVTDQSTEQPTTDRLKQHGFHEM